MKRILFAGILFLTACSADSVVVRSPRHMVVMPDEGMFTCAIADTFPASETLTDIQVARFIVRLYQNNVQCRNSLDAIRTFLENAKKVAEDENSSQP